jgi:hypothetical protein
MQRTAPTRRSVVLAAIVAFAVAVTARVPSCYASLWLDELHSAWCVEGELAQVFPRAELGHQSPLYFVALWFWKQLVGQTEVALRLSSVLTVAAGSAVLTVGVARWTGSAAAGWASGMVLAMDSHSLFFGTELRPYALVILLSSLAIVCFLQLVQQPSRHEHRGGWSLFIAASLLAGLAQPTSLGVLLWPAAVLLVVWWRCDRAALCTLTWHDGWVAVAIAAIGWSLWSTTLGDSWQQRSIWGSFAAATDVRQMVQAWEWKWMLFAPLGATLVGLRLAASRAAAADVHDVARVTALLGLITVAATAVYWLIAHVGAVPIWHRRYFVAVLPILACVVGGATGTIAGALSSSRRSLVIGYLVAVVLLCWPSRQRDLWMRLLDYPVALVSRGEDWRGAVDWVRQRAELDDLVLIDAGLIEASAWLARDESAENSPRQRGPSSVPVDDPGGAKRHSDQARQAYLVYPVRGPYRLEQQVVPAVYPPVRPVSDGRGQHLFWIVRRPASRIRASLAAGSQLVGFGNVTVVEQSRH